MKKHFFTFLASIFVSGSLLAQESSKVDYDAFEVLVKKVKSHRAERLVSIERFNSMSQLKNTVILDTRSKAMYDAKHIKGAVHLNFADFTQERLESMFPDKKTTILIYCNNNIDDDPVYFPTKSYTPTTPGEENELELTLALNIPTYINLYGYGYRNVYELSEFISAVDMRIRYEGTAVKP